MIRKALGFLLLVSMPLFLGQACRVTDPPSESIQATHEWRYEGGVSNGCGMTCGSWSHTWTRVRLENGTYEVWDSVISVNSPHGGPYSTDTAVTRRNYSLAEGVSYLKRDFEPTGTILHQGDVIYYHFQPNNNGKPEYAFSKKLGHVMYSSNTFMSSHGSGRYSYFGLVSFDGDSLEVQKIKDLLREAYSP